MRSRLTAALRAAWAWAAVHAIVSGAAILVASTMSSIALGRYLLDGIGPIRFVAPISVLLLIPVIAGTAVAIGCHNEARIPLPDPAREKFARAGWASLWTVLAIAASNSGQFEGAGPPWQVVARNVVLLAALSLSVAVLRAPNAVWLPPVVFAMLTILFGSSEVGPGSIWWSVLLREQTSARELTAVVSAWLVATAAYALRPPQSLRGAGARGLRPVLSRIRSRGPDRREGRAR